MTPEELAKKELEKLRKSGKLTFPIDPFKILNIASLPTLNISATCSCVSPIYFLSFLSLSPIFL